MPEGRKNNKENDSYQIFDSLLVLLYLFIPQWIKKKHTWRAKNHLIGAEYGRITLSSARVPR